MSEPEEEDEEAALTRSYQVGISVGLDEASGMVLKEATYYFQLGKDERATYLRELSERLKKLADERHPGVPGAKKK